MKFLRTCLVLNESVFQIVYSSLGLLASLGFLLYSLIIDGPISENLSQRALISLTIFAYSVMNAVSSRPPNHVMTLGFKRLRDLGGFIVATSLFAVFMFTIMDALNVYIGAHDDGHDETEVSTWNFFFYFFMGLIAYDVIGLFVFFTKDFFRLFTTVKGLKITHSEEEKQRKYHSKNDDTKRLIDSPMDHLSASADEPQFNVLAPCDCCNIHMSNAFFSPTGQVIATSSEMRKKVLLDCDACASQSTLSPRRSSNMPPQQPSEDTETVPNKVDGAEAAVATNPEADDCPTEDECVHQQHSPRHLVHTHPSTIETLNLFRQGQSEAEAEECQFYEKRREIDSANAAVMLAFIADLCLVTLNGIMSWLRGKEKGGWVMPMGIENYEYFVHNIVLILISIFFMFFSAKLLYRISLVLLMGQPRSICPNHIRRTILSTPGILSVHELHLWTVELGVAEGTFHVVLEETPHSKVLFRETILPFLTSSLHRHGIHKFTVQPEFVDLSNTKFHEHDLPEEENTDRLYWMKENKPICFSGCDKKCTTDVCCTARVKSN